MRRLLLPDLLRSLALVLMIAYHVAYDLAAYAHFSIDTQSGAWFIIGRSSALLFFGLSGLSMTLAKNSASKLQRAFQILLSALLVTVITYLFDSDSYVRFGALHLLGVFALLAPFIIRLPSLAALVFGLLICALGLQPHVLHQITAALPAWAALIIGSAPSSFVSVDYYPLFPWGGAILLGYSAGRELHSWLLKTSSVEESSVWLRWMSAPGRHSLLIYLLHQPIVLGVLSLI